MYFRSALSCAVWMLAPVFIEGSAEASEGAPVVGTKTVESSARLASLLAEDDFTAAAALASELAAQGEPAGMYVLGVLTDIGVAAEIDPKQALHWLLAAAERGHAGAGRYLSWRYDSGFGGDGSQPTEAARWMQVATNADTSGAFPSRWVERTARGDVPNLRRAFLWMLDAAEDGRVVAQVNLAHAYAGGDWTAADTDQHLFWLKKAADNRHPGSLEQLALYYEHGLLVAPDARLALEFRQRAAETGSASAQFTLAEMYLTGRGVVQDAARAADWLRKAAAQDHIDAMLALVTLLRDGASGVAPDFAEAMRVARRAASLGSSNALTHIADLHNRGDGVPKDAAKSAEFYRQAADKGAVRAMTMLGWIYLHGELGTPDYAEARRWLVRAAEAGDLRAMRELAGMEERGQGAVPDTARAFEWFERAARDGERFSQMRLSWMLARGIGCERDDEEALVWLRLASGRPDGARAALAEAAEKTPLDVIRFLLASASQVDAGWIPSYLVQVCDRVPPADAAAGRDLLRSWITNPALCREGGCLPEAVLAILEQSKTLGDATAATDLLVRLIAANRPQSQLLLAEHAFYGRNMPYDLALARRCARAAEDQKMSGAERIRAAMESIVAPVEAERNAAKATLRRLAQNGDAEAARILARRFQGAVGEEYSPETARTFIQLSVNDPARHAAALKRYDETFGSAPRPPTETEIRARVEQVLHSRKKDAPPVIVYRHQPSYPMELRESGLEGQATIRFVVDEEGVPREVRATESTHPLFAAAGEGCIKLWRFAPGRKRGRAVAVALIQPLTFSLEEEPVGSRETQP